MGHWNRTGKIKAAILGLVAVPNLIFPLEDQGERGTEVILMPLIFGSLAIPLIAWFNQALFAREITKPTWNDNPLTLRRPLSFFHFASLFFLTVGFSVLIGSWIKEQALNFFSLTLISFGLGMLSGIWLTVRWSKAPA